MFLLPVCKMKLKTTATTVKMVQCWTEDYRQQLWGGLQITDWSVFKTTDLNVDADHVTGYINRLVEECIHKTVHLQTGNHG